jgi:hypothetical protein
MADLYRNFDDLLDAPTLNFFFWKVAIRLMYGAYVFADEGTLSDRQCVRSY